MLPDERDLALLWDMLAAAREVAGFVQGVRWGEFETDRKLRLAVERQIMVVGEAARRVSLRFQSAHPEIEWKGIVGQRNVLAHEYGEILVERVWLVATKHIPELVRALEPLVPPD